MRSVQDGSTNDESRWSCQGFGCAVTYTLEEEQHIEALQIGERIQLHSSRGSTAFVWRRSINRRIGVI